MSPTRPPAEEDLALARSLFGVLPTLGRIAGRAAHECGFGSPERARLLFMLKAAGGARAGWLAQHAKLSPSAISELVEGLEGEKLARREDDPDDRRGVRVVLTAEGRRQVQRFEEHAARTIAEALVHLTPIQRQRLSSAFADLRSALASLDEAEEAASVR